MCELDITKIHTCATLLPPLLILLVVAHYKLDIKWRISSTTLPRKE